MTSVSRHSAQRYNFLGSNDITDYLKGVAILTIYINYFINGYVSREFSGYANGFVALFFILSGYGIFISLSHLSDSNHKNVLYTFFKKRILRIYPIFWIWCIIHGFSNGFIGFCP